MPHGIALLLCVLSPSIAAEAAVRTWTGGGASDDTSLAANWDSGAPAPGDDLAFAGTIRLTPNQVAALAVSSLGFNSGAGGFVLGGSTYTVGTGGVTNNSTATQTINNALTLSSAQTWSATAGDLRFGGAINNGGFGLTIAGSSRTTANGAIGGSGGITKIGAGALTLTAANSYTGATSISAGVVNIQNASALGSTVAGTTVSSGAALQLQGGVAVGAEALTLNGSGIASDGALRNISGNNSFAGAITFGSAATIASDAGTLTLSGTLANGGFGVNVSGSGNVVANGVISGTGGLTKNGAGTLTLSVANSYSGTTTINSGTVAVVSNSLGSGALTINAGTLEITSTFSSSRSITLGDAASTFQVDPLQTLTLTSALGGSGSLNKTGTGTLVLSAANTYGGATLITAGKLTLTASGVIPDNSAVTVSGTFDMGGAGTTPITETIGSLSGSGVVDYSVTGNNHDGALTVGNNNASTTFSGVLQEGANPLSLTKVGTGTLTLSGANTLTGTVTVNAGVLRLDNTSALGSGNLNINGGVLGLGAGNFTRAVGTGAGQVQLNIGGFAAYNVDRTVNLGGVSGTMTWASTPGFLAAGQPFILGAADADRTLTFQNPINFNGAIRTIQVNDGAAAFDATLSGVLSGTGGGFIKTGAGTLFLTGANTFSGNVTINAGTIAIISGTLGSGTLAINAGTLEVTTTFSTTRSISLGDATSTFEIDPAQTYTLTNPISGTGTLNKTGSGTLSLAGVNTYSGGTVINAGTVVANSSASLGASGAVTTINAGTLEIAGSYSSARNFVLGNSASTIMVDPSQTFTVGNVISGSGNLNKSGTGTLALTGADTYSGSTYVTAGTLSLGAGAALASTVLNVSSGATFTGNASASLPNTLAVAANGNVTFNAAARTIASLDGASTGVVTLNSTNLSVSSGSYAGVLQNGASTGSLTKTSAGTLTLTGANTYTGGTMIGQGNLVAAASSDGALGSTSSVTVNSGGTLLLGASDQINNTAGVTLAGGTFAKGNFSEGATNAAGVGALTLTATGSHIDFGTGTVGVLSFASFSPGANTLTVDNWTGTANSVGTASTDRLIFDADQSANLSSFSFTGYASGAVEFALGGGFYEVTPVTPVPEPSTYVAGFLAFAGIAVNQLRRRKSRSTCAQHNRCLEGDA